MTKPSHPLKPPKPKPQLCPACGKECGKGEALADKVGDEGGGGAEGAEGGEGAAAAAAATAASGEVMEEVAGLCGACAVRWQEGCYCPVCMMLWEDGDGDMLG